MKIHFVGIGGIGLSALARILRHDGHIISGSDMKYTPLINSLEKESIEICVPHCVSAIKDQDLLIYSAAVKSDNCELVEAQKKGIKTISRKEALELVLSNKKNYCVAGAHGKSTTTAMLCSILQSSALIGAISKEFGSNFRYVDDLLVFEADESDGSFVRSNPYCAIVTNAEPEHMEYYNHDLDKFHSAYKEYLNIAKYRVFNAEDEFLSTLDDIDATKLYPSKDISNVSYDLKDNEPYTTFTLKDFGEFEVWGFGFHTAINASLAILAAQNELEIEQIKKNLRAYKGIKKRFDIIQKSEDFVVIDDYAHHPTEIRATINSLKQYQQIHSRGEMIIIWQPHKYSRTIENLDEFKKCFEGCDELVILPVYSAGESTIDIDFEKEFKQYNPIFAKKIISKFGNLNLIDKNNNIIKTYKQGLIAGVGAGDITYQLNNLE